MRLVGVTFSARHHLGKLLDAGVALEDADGGDRAAGLALADDLFDEVEVAVGVRGNLGQVRDAKDLMPALIEASVGVLRASRPVPGPPGRGRPRLASLLTRLARGRRSGSLGEAAELVADDAAEPAADVRVDLVEHQHADLPPPAPGSTIGRAGRFSGGGLRIDF